MGRFANDNREWTRMDANKNLTQRHEDTKVTANGREWIRLRKAYGAIRQQIYAAKERVKSER
jgi:hypothetical protein